MSVHADAFAAGMLVLIILPVLYLTYRSYIESRHSPEAIQMPDEEEA